MEKKGLGSLLNDTVIYGLARVVSSAISVFLIPIYTRYFSVADYGVIDNLNIYHIFLVNLFSLALTQGLYRFYATEDKPDEKVRILSTIHFATLGLSGLGLVGGVIIGSFIGEMVIGKSQQENLQLLFLASLLSLLVMNLTVYQEVLRINFRKFHYLVTSLGVVIGGIILTIVFVVGFKWGIESVFLSQCLVNLFFGAVSYFFVRKELQLGAFSFAWLKKLVPFSVAFVPAAFSMLVMRSSDRYFIVWLMEDPLHQIGLYAMGEKLVMPLLILGAAFAIAYPPFAMRVSKQENANELYTNTFKYYIAINAISIIGLSAISTLLLKILATPPFWPAAVYTPVLGLYLSMNALFYISSIGLMLSQKTQWLVPIVIIAALVNLVLNFFLIPPFGVFGAAWATVISIFLYNFSTFVIAERFHYVGYPLFKGFLVLGLATLVAHLFFIQFWIGILLTFLFVALLFFLNFLNRSLFEAISSKIKQMNPGR